MQKRIARTKSDFIFKGAVSLLDDRTLRETPARTTTVNELTLFSYWPLFILAAMKRLVLISVKNINQSASFVCVSISWIVMPCLDMSALPRYWSFILT